MNAREPLRRALVAKSHPAYYRMHKYWARKPHNVVRAYIEHFSAPGELVFDPFAGSGVTLLESLLSGRRAIAVDLNPMSQLITEATATPVDLLQAEAAFQVLRAAVEPLAKEAFNTLCPGCRQPAVINYVAWSSTAPCSRCGEVLVLSETPKEGAKYRCPGCSALVAAPSRVVTGERAIEICLDCAQCGTRTKTPTWEDVAVFDAAPSTPTQGFMLPSKRLLVHEGMDFEDYFTPRNLALLRRLRDEINRLDDDLKRLFTFTFTASVAGASRLIPYRNGLTSGGPAWTVSGFWVPSLHLEQNAWNCFANRWAKVRRGKEVLSREAADALPFVGARHFADLNGGATALLSNQSSAELGNLLPDNSVDYIFTDPPYGDSVPYLEYSAFWLGWLGMRADFEREVIISDSKARHKDLDNYRELLAQVFKECFRVVRPGRYLSVTFHNRHLAVWEALMEAACNAGWEFTNCNYQVPAVVPAKAQLSKNGSVTGDIILNFRKPLCATQTNRAATGTDHEVAQAIWSEAEQIIAERDGQATTDELVTGVIMFLLERGWQTPRHNDLIALLAQRYHQTESQWRFRDGEQSKIAQHTPLKERVRAIVAECFAKGQMAQKDVTAEVFSQLTAGRTPALALVLQCYEERVGRLSEARKTPPKVTKVNEEQLSFFDMA